jgi:DNA-binding response OmpR family regulator
MSTRADPPLPLILVAHHAQDTVELLRSLLEREGYTVLRAYNGRAALQYAQQHQPALVLLDQALPLLDGLELCRELRQESDRLPVFILSDRSDELSKLLAFAAGADDYLPLPLHPRELLGRVAAVLRRSAPAASQKTTRLRCGTIELDLERHQALAAGRQVPLTSLEYKLLEVFVAQPGRVFSREELLDRLSGFLRGDPFIRTVDIHVSNLRRKLQAVSGAKAPIETVRGIGYRLHAEAVAGAPGSDAPDAPSLGFVALAALDRVPTPLLVLAPDRTVLLYNEAAQRLCGWGADEVAGQVKCYSLLSCHSADGRLLCRDDCPLHAARRVGLREQHARYVITLKDGRELPVTAEYRRLNRDDDARDCTLLLLEPEQAPLS